MSKVRCQRLFCLPMFLFLTLSIPADSVLGQVVVDVEEANITGQLVRLSPLALTMRTPLGVYEVDVVNREFRELLPARITVKGEKPPSYLQRGMLVRLVGEIEDGRKIREPVSEVFVVDPAAPLAPVGADGAAVDDPGPPEDAGQVFVGRVRTFRLNVLSIEVPGERRPQVLQAKLTDDAVVKISFNRLSAASPGDQVQVKGWKELGGRARRIWAEEVIITSSAEAPDPRLARGAKPEPGGPRPAFGDLGGEEPKPAALEEDAPQYEGVILEIN